MFLWCIGNRVLDRSNVVSVPHNRYCQEAWYRYWMDRWILVIGVVLNADQKIRALRWNRRIRRSFGHLCCKTARINEFLSALFLLLGRQKNVKRRRRELKETREHITPRFAIRPQLHARDPLRSKAAGGRVSQRAMWRLGPGNVYVCMFVLNGLPKRGKIREV